MAKCNKCGLEFEADDLCGRTPCPNCGATTRTVEENVAFGVAASDHAMLELRLEEKTIAFRESERDGRITAADEENGKITTAVTGSSPQGETDTLNVCRTLVRKLDGTWGEPIEWTEQNSDIDCVSKNTADENDVLYIQVIRAIVDDTWWHTLASSGTNTKSGTADELTEAILRVIRKKSDRTPLNRRRKLVLAIDANRLAGLTLDSVVDRVREKHGATLAVLSFRSIWLVGPSISRTHQLDIPS